MNQTALKTHKIQENLDLSAQARNVAFQNKDFARVDFAKLLNLTTSEAQEKSNYSVIPELPNTKELSDIIQKLKNKIKLSKTEELQLISKIEKNNPALSIFTKFKRGDYFENIIFSGIKELNDKTSQSFTDKVLLRFKNSVLKAYPGVEVVWNDYKNFTLRTSKEISLDSNTLNILLSKSLTKELSMSKYNGRLIPDFLRVHNKKGVIGGKTQEEVLHDIAFTRLFLERQSIKSGVLKKREIKSREKSLQSRYFDTKGELLDKVELSSGYIYYIKNNVLYLEYESGGIKKLEKTLIFGSYNKFTVNFITKIRKKEIPVEMNMYKEARILIDSYIGRGEFIAPVIREKNLPEGQIISSAKTNKYIELKEKLSNSDLKEIEVGLLQFLAENTYKNALDKFVFYEKIKTSGELFYIDIKDMGSINIKDFSDKIEDWNNGEISTKEIIMKSGEYMTERFQYLTKILKDSLSLLYPGKEIFISIGGDEIMIYVEGTLQIDSNESLEFINSVFRQLDFGNLEGRITYRYIKENEVAIGGEKLIEELDVLTKKTKAIEKRIGSIKNNLLISLSNTFQQYERDIISIKLQELSRLQNFSLTIEDGIEYIIFYSNPFKDVSNKLKLSLIIDDNLKLKPNPPSPFTRYLDDHGFGRGKDRN